MLQGTRLKDKGLRRKASSLQSKNFKGTESNTHQRLLGAFVIPSLWLFMRKVSATGPIFQAKKSFPTECQY